MTTALLEQNQDRTWVAYVKIGPHMVTGQGDTAALAKADLLKGVEFLNVELPEDERYDGAELSFKIL